MYSPWKDDESMLELKPRQFCYSYELESMREELLGEIGMQETTNLLYQLLTDACQERDEAREQLKRSVAEISELKKILNKLLGSNNSAETSPAISHVPPGGTQKQEILKGSDAISEAYNNYSGDSSSPANSIPGTMFNANLTDSSNNLGLLKKSFVQDSDGYIRMGNFPSKDLAVDGAAKVIDKLVKGKPLPEKGRLLEAVIDTSPMLETLMITGQLPKWRNPPTFPSSFIADEAIIKSKSTASTSSSTMFNFRKRSNGMDLESLEHAGIQKKFY